MPGFFRVAICSVILLMMFILLGCEAAPSAVPNSAPYVPATPTFTPYLPVTPTATQTPTLNPTPVPTGTPTMTPTVSPNVSATSTGCRGFIWAYGTVSPDFINQVQDAMRSAGVEGTVGAGTFGETDLCGAHYGAQQVDYGFTLQVGESDTREDLARKVAIVREIAQRFLAQAPAHELGNFGVTFKSGELQCTWRYDESEWEFFSLTAAVGAGCRLPTNDETRRLAAALTALSVDLACESFTMTADMSSVGLECNRTYRANRYTVRVTFAYDPPKMAGGTCFHGWPAHENSSEPVTVIEDGRTSYEQERNFEWTASGPTIFIYERIRGGQHAAFPSDAYEKVYLRGLKERLITGAGPGEECGH